MWGLHAADVIVLIAYLAGATLLGTWAARRIRTSGDFFMPRRFGKTLMITHAFGTGTHSDQAVSVASKSFTNGLSGIWYQWLWLFCTPFYWLIAPVMRRMRAITVSDVFTARYNIGVGMLFALVGTFNLTFNIGVMLKGSGAVIAACFGNQVHPNTVIFMITGLFLAYGMAGGLSAAILTDFVQGILTVVFSFILVPFVMEAVGGFSGLREKIANPEMFRLVAPADIGLFYIAMIALNGLVGIVTQPHVMGNCAAGRTEYDGRVGFTGGNFVKRLCTMAWCVTGLAALAYLGPGVNPDHVYGLMARDFFPRILPGLLGVFLASVLASIMSSCDSFMIASSALFTENVYKPLVRGKEPRHYLLVGRITSFVIVGGGLLAAYLLESVVQGLEIFWMIPPMMGIVFWLGLFWRRTTVAGAWAATAAGFGTLLLTTTDFFIRFIDLHPLADTLRFTVGVGDKLSLYLPWQMAFYLFAGAAAGVVVSLLTRPVDPEKLDRFYELARTPVRNGEPSPEKPCTLPPGVDPAPRRVLLERFGLEILMPSRISVIGFAVAWGIVAVLILVFFWITR